MACMEHYCDNCGNMVGNNSTGVFICCGLPMKRTFDEGPMEHKQPKELTDEDFEIVYNDKD